MKSVYYGFGSVLLIGVVAALYLLYQNVSNPTVASNYQSVVQSQAEPGEQDFGWLEGLSQTGVTHNQYPVEELNMQFALSDLPEPKKIHRLLAKNIDRYQYFCIEQIFAQNKVEYSILKQEKNLIANVMNLDNAKLDTLKKSLDYYEIDYNFDIFYEKDY